MLGWIVTRSTQDWKKDQDTVMSYYECCKFHLRKWYVKKKLTSSRDSLEGLEKMAVGPPCRRGGTQEAGLEANALGRMWLGSESWPRSDMWTIDGHRWRSEYVRLRKKNCREFSAPFQEQIFHLSSRPRARFFAVRWLEQTGSIASTHE